MYFLEFGFSLIQDRYLLGDKVEDEFLGRGETVDVKIQKYEIGWRREKVFMRDCFVNCEDSAFLSGMFMYMLCIVQRMELDSFLLLNILKNIDRDEYLDVRRQEESFEFFFQKGF